LSKKDNQKTYFLTKNPEEPNFFKKIEGAYPKKTTVYVFCDNARYYRNREIQEYLKTSKIKLLLLPPYSPNLNPIERLWKWMKERVLSNTYYADFNPSLQAWNF